jgi:hypothetical protein
MIEVPEWVGKFVAIAETCPECGADLRAADGPGLREEGYMAVDQEIRFVSGGDELEHGNDYNDYYEAQHTTGYTCGGCGADVTVDAGPAPPVRPAGPRVVAIKSGGDWTDADVQHVVAPPGLDFDAAHARYRAWYADEYVTIYPRRERPEYMTFDQWLVQREGCAPGGVEEFHEENHRP